MQGAGQMRVTEPMAEASAPEWPGPRWPRAIATATPQALTRSGGVRTMEHGVGGAGLCRHLTPLSGLLAW